MTDDAAAYAARNRELLAEALEIVDAARGSDLHARLLGGLGIMHHDEGLRTQGGTRPINDIDLIVAAGEHRAIAQLLTDRGYRPEERFNALNGHRRMVFHADGWDLDVLVGVFEMCHRIEMSEQISLDYPTLPATDLLLTKLQIVKLNAKDATDIVELVSTHDLGHGPGDWIDVDRVAQLIRDDWGLWRTITGTIHTVTEMTAPDEVLERLGRLERELDEVPKTRRWRLRARVGDRVAWYVLPDEVHQ
jgi:Uncharacterised nucleotidyltransferase